MLTVGRALFLIHELDGSQKPMIHLNFYRITLNHFLKNIAISRLVCFFYFTSRHDLPTDPNDPLADQNIKDRYYGTSDPVATRLLTQAKSMPSLEPPSDKSITTLYVGGLEGKVEEGDLR